MRNSIFILKDNLFLNYCYFGLWYKIGWFNSEIG